MNRPTIAAHSLGAGMSVVLALACASKLESQVNYARAERLLDWNLVPRMFGVVTEAHWLDDGTRLWYHVKTPNGIEFLLVDLTRNTRRPLFDTGRLAGAMASAADTNIDAAHLALTDVEVPANLGQVDFRSGRRRFRCDIVVYRCVARAMAPQESIAARSPDGRWDAFVDGSNLFIRPAGGGDSIALTTDGSALWAYGLPYAYPSSIRSFVQPQPVAASLRWSPDSRKIAIARWDQRGLKLFPLYSSTGIRPTLYVYPYALPGDSAVTTFDVHVIDVAAKTNVRVAVPPSPYLDGPASTFTAGNWQAVKWSSNSDRLFVLNTSRGSKRITLFKVDPSSGQASAIVGDSSETTTVELSSNLIDVIWDVPDNGRTVLWFSWRDGWGHLYRFDGNGRLENRVTTGPWTIEKICFIDEHARQIFFTGRGQAPNRFIYHSYLYRVNFDGSGLRLLTPENAHHVVSCSPTGKFFVDTYSRLDLPPVSVARSSADGRIVRELERADVGRLSDVAWTPPEVFRVTAADGISDIYGLMYKPSDFDSTKSYPIIDHIYPVPSGSVRSWGFPTFASGGSGDPRALAELGFIVVDIVGRGTRFRSKTFLDAYQGHMGQNTLPDHVAGIRQLAAQHRWIDIDRVGIYGLSGGGFAAAAGMLRYPDFYKVGVAMAGNHDNRSYSVEWGEKFQGLLTRDPKSGKDSYEDEANYVLAKNLKGKLLLMHGDLDDNVHPALTLRLVHALIEANKDFDLLILPDRGHALTSDPYVIRRMWDYFVRNLLHQEPPAQYHFAPAPMAP